MLINSLFFQFIQLSNVDIDPDIVDGCLNHKLIMR